MSQRRVLIADDHPIFRGGLVALLEAMDSVVVAGQATSGEAAVRLVEELEPDIVLMDINMPGLNGIEAARRIVASRPGVAVVMLTMFDDDDSVFAAMRAGARGYLLKGSDEGQIRRALDAAGEGDAIFGPAIAARMMAYFGTGRKTAPSPELTEREREILALIADGLTNEQISDRLHISPKTTRNHVSNVFGKLQVADRVQAALRARDAGLGSGPAHRGTDRPPRGG